jgi:hypothetical protein
MKRSRHPSRRKQKAFLMEMHEPVGMADLYPDLMADVPESLRRTLPSELIKAELREQRELLAVAVNNGSLFLWRISRPKTNPQTHVARYSQPLV